MRSQSEVEGTAIIDGEKAMTYRVEPEWQLPGSTTSMGFTTRFVSRCTCQCSPSRGGDVSVPSSQRSQVRREEAATLGSAVRLEGVT